MALAQSHNLDISLKQQLTLTPQLQQAIKILNMNSVDLNLEVSQMLSQNFMLELQEDLFVERTPEKREETGEGLLEKIDTELDYDSSWEEYYDHDWQDHAPYREKAPNLEEYIDNSGNLSTYLGGQLDQMPLDSKTRATAQIFLYHLDENGYLREKVIDLAHQYGLDLDTTRAAIKAIKNCQPSGVGAFDLEECLNLQITMLEKDTPYLNILKRIMARHFLFIHKNPAMIRNRLGIDQTSYNHAIALLRSLTPCPGYIYNKRMTPYVRPEIIVREKGGISYVECGENLRPALSINTAYADLVKHARAHEKTLLQAQLNEARWFLSAIDKRAEAIQRVASLVVALQQDFFQEGEKAMHSLTRQKIATMLDIHESTVSRAINGKYLICKRGIYELRYFFSNLLATVDGEERSTTAIKAIIAEMIEEENPQKPLSDQKIADSLGNKGYNIARRTIAKYREELNIAPSSVRRQR